MPIKVYITINVCISAALDQPNNNTNYNAKLCLH